MRRISKTSAGRRAAHILKSNDGASIVLVSIIAILVITAVVILRMSTSSLMAGSDKQYRQDQAYMMATSMGASLDNLIVTKTIRLTNYTDPNGGTHADLLKQNGLYSSMWAAHISTKDGGAEDVSDPEKLL